MQPDFDTGADIAVIDDRLRRAVAIGEAQIEQLAGFVEDAVLRQGDESDHACFRTLVDKFAKAKQIDRPRRTGIERRSHTGCQANLIEVAAIRIYTPVTVHVEVDQSRRDIAARGVDDALDIRARDIPLNRCDTIAFDADVEFLVGLGRRIDNRAAGQK